MFDALLIDMDGTLVDSEEITIAALAEVLRRHKAELTEDLRSFTARHAWDRVLEALYAAFPQLPPFEEFIAEVLTLKAAIMAEGPIPLLPGARELFIRLHARCKLAIVSGSFHSEIEQLIDRIDVRPLVDAVVGGDDCAHHKPHPEPFLRGARLVDVPPRRCLVLEDSPFGIASGVDAGMAVAAIRAGNRYDFDQRGAHLTVATLNDITPAFLDALWPCYEAWRVLPAERRAAALPLKV